MKKFYVILIVSFLALFNNCEKDEQIDPQPKEVREFLNSEDFKNHECFFDSCGIIDVGKVEWLQISGDSACQLMIPFLNRLDKTITAYLQVIKVPEGELPNKEVYFMNLVYLKEGFDNSTITGDVVMLGINYSNFQHSELTVVNNIIVSSKFNTTPDKYLEFEEEQSTKGRVMDFLACYRKTRQAMDNDDVLFFICNVTDIVAPVCTLSAAAYCIHEAQTTK